MCVPNDRASTGIRLVYVVLSSAWLSYALVLGACQPALDGVGSTSLVQVRAGCVDSVSMKSVLRNGTVDRTWRRVRLRSQRPFVCMCATGSRVDAMLIMVFRSFLVRDRGASLLFIVPVRTDVHRCLPLMTLMEFLGRGVDGVNVVM